MCWYSQSAADTSLAFGASRSGWWMNGKAFTILNTSFLSELSRIMAAKTRKKSVSLTDWGSNFLRRGRKPIYLKKNRKLHILWLWCQYFSRLRMRINNWKICHKPILAFYLKRLLLLVRTKSINENFVSRKLRPLLVFVIIMQRIFPS